MIVGKSYVSLEVLPVKERSCDRSGSSWKLMNFVLLSYALIIQIHGSQSPIRLSGVSHCVIKSYFLIWFNLSI